MTYLVLQCDSGGNSKGRLLSTNPSVALLRLLSNSMISRDNKGLGHFVFSERDSYLLMFTLEETIRML